MWFAVGSAFAAPAATPFSCCDDPALARVAASALALHDALTGGKGRPSTTMRTLASQLSALDLRGVEAIVAAQIREAADRGKASDDAAREQFATVAGGVAWLALRHEGGDLSVVEAGCGHTAWLQSPASAPAGPGCRADWR